MREQVIMKDIQGVCNTSGTGVRLFRNNVGAYEVDNTCSVCGSRCAEGPKRYIEYGLGKGSADLVGLVKVTITPDMVGQNFGRFLAVEVKTPTGRVTPHQNAWLEAVRRQGGIAVVLHSVEEAKALIEGFQNVGC